MIICMSVSLFSHRPLRCPFGHPLWPGLARVGWKPCICTPAREQAERGGGMGHLWVSCQTCHTQLWDATFYEPPHDISCHQAGPGSPDRPAGRASPAAATGAAPAAPAGGW